MIWEKIPFARLYSIPSKNGLTRPSRVRGTGYKMVNMGELFGNDKIGSISMELVPMNAKELKNMRLEKGDLLFARQSLVLSGAGKCSIVSEVTEPTTFESHIIRIRLNTKLAFPLFYFYYFKSPICNIRSIVTQGVQAGIRGNDLKKLKVHLPPTNTQQKIASILASYDDLIENNRRRIQLLEESARLLYKEWFVHLRFPGHENTKIVGGVPDGWERKSIGNIVDIKKGKNITKKIANEGDIPVVAGGLMPAYYHDKANVNGPVVTISASGANAGYVSLYYEDIWASDCSYLSIESTLFIYFFYLFFQERQKEIFGLQKGSAQPHVYPKDLMRINMIRPPIRLIERFEENILDSFTLIKKLKIQNQKLSKARDLLLPRLMNGEVEF